MPSAGEGGLGELASVGELLRSFHDRVAGFAPETGFEEGPQAVAAGQVVCHGDVAPRNTVFRDGRATAFIDWDGIFVSAPMWDLAHAVWQFAPVCDDADPWLGDWPSTPDRSARIAALVGGYRLSADRAHGLADMVVEVIAGCRRSVVCKIAAGIPAFVQMEREGILAALDSQHRAAEQHRTLVAQAAAA
ncbi:phosphotransferase [Candidatus Poriferisodalis sp.]|uniref:phosphotransferase n=1 Tax=Candidatus Poriferisodalis sp. TaxID=3101277 RepID=UPI003C6FA3E4